MLFPKRHLTIDGEETQIYKELNSLIAFDITEGEHTVTLTYLPKCYKYGALITLTCTSVFVIIVGSEYIIKRIKIKAKKKVGIQ